VAATNKAAAVEAGYSEKSRAQRHSIFQIQGWKMPKLAPKGQCFVERFCFHVIASKGARKAGFSVKTAERISLEKLLFPEVQQPGMMRGPTWRSSAERRRLFGEKERRLQSQHRHELLFRSMPPWIGRCSRDFRQGNIEQEAAALNLLRFRHSVETNLDFFANCA
jgi:hypothetical protein